MNTKTATTANKQLKAYLAKAQQYLNDAALLATCNDDVFDQEDQHLVRGLSRLAGTVNQHFGDRA